MGDGLFGAIRGIGQRTGEGASLQTEGAGDGKVAKRRRAPRGWLPGLEADGEAAHDAPGRVGHRNLVQEGPSQHLPEEEIANREGKLPLGPAPVGEGNELDQLHVEPGRVLVGGRQRRMRRRQTGMTDHAICGTESGSRRTQSRHHFGREVVDNGTLPDR